MVALQVITLNGLDGVLDESKAAEFKDMLRGSLIQPGDESYDEQRQVWNANIDRRPTLIARCAGVADVFVPLILLGRTFFWFRCGGAATTSPATPSAMPVS